MISRLPILAVLLCAFCVARPARAQTLDDIRQTFRENLAESHFAKALAGQVMATDEIDLAGAHYSMDNESDARLAVLAIPYSHTFRPWGSGEYVPPRGPELPRIPPPGLYVEAAVGYSKAREHVDDLYAGTAPGLETAVSSDMITLSGLVGAGPQFSFGSYLTFTPIVNASIAYIDNDADYGGPGAATTAAIADGLAFNWESWAWGVGTAARLEYTREFGSFYDFTLLARYDLRWTETFATDDEAQEFGARSQIATLRADVTGPIWRGASIAGSHEDGRSALRWRATLGYRAFLEGDLYDTKNYVTLGGGLDLTGALPLGGEANVEAGIILGDDVTGYYMGLGLSF